MGDNWCVESVDSATVMTALVLTINLGGSTSVVPSSSLSVSRTSCSNLHQASNHLRTCEMRMLVGARSRFKSVEKGEF